MSILTGDKSTPGLNLGRRWGGCFIKKDIMEAKTRWKNSSWGYLTHCLGKISLLSLRIIMTNAQQSEYI